MESITSIIFFFNVLSRNIFLSNIQIVNVNIFLNNFFDNFFKGAFDFLKNKGLERQYFFILVNAEINYGTEKKEMTKD